MTELRQYSDGFPPRRKGHRSRELLLIVAMTVMVALAGFALLLAAGVIGSLG
jgi:hypothetical protein